MKNFICGLLVVSAFASVAQASDCDLDCNSIVCEVVFPNGEVFATYERNYSYTIKESQKPSVVEVLAESKEEKMEIANLMELCRLKSVK